MPPGLGVQHVGFLDHLDGTLAALDHDAFVAEVAEVVDDFAPDVVVTFGPDGFYGHPDHVTAGNVVTAACRRRPQLRLYHSFFARSRMLLLERLAEWLVELQDRFEGPDDFARVFSVFAQETTAVGYADDHIDIAWFPPGVAIVEQGEAADALYLLLSGEVEVSQDQPDGSRTFIRRQGPGSFFGELGIAQGDVRSAHVVSVGSVTCMVFQRQAATAWAGRGTTSLLEAGGGFGPDEGDPAFVGAAVVDVRHVVDRKVAAVAAHRTQYPIEPLFPAGCSRDDGHRALRAGPTPPVEPETSLFA